MNTTKANEHVQGRTLSTAGQTKGGERTDGAEDVSRDHRRDLPALHVGPEELETRAARNNDLLCSGSGEVARDGMRNRSGGLEGEIVQVDEESDAEQS